MVEVCTSLYNYRKCRELQVDIFPACTLYHQQIEAVFKVADNVCAVKKHI